jgi:hypothetical protein
VKRFFLVVGCGALAGPLVGPMFRALNTLAGAPPTATDLGSVTALAFAVWTGIAYAVSFYVFCAVPATFVRRHLAQVSPNACMFGTALVGLVGSAPAYVTTGLLLNRTSAPPAVSRIALADGLLVMIVVMAVSSWQRRIAEQRLLTAQARSNALQAQISPHFFFNTLNTIVALIPSDSDAAQHTIACLADMSRYAFCSTHRPSVSLADEMLFTRLYLDIERARFGQRLQWDLPPDSDLEGLELPPLTIQPLVENAVRHGIARRPEGGRVWVRVVRQGAHFSVTVENDVDDGVLVTEAAFFRPSHALQNIRDRIRLIYKGIASIAISVPEKDRVAVTIHAVPLAT